MTRLSKHTDPRSFQRTIGQYLFMLMALAFMAYRAHAQEPVRDTLSQGNLVINGELHPYMIDECGDTVILANLQDVSVTAIRDFQTQEDQYRYRRYRQYALKVYPYAVDAIRIFRETEYATNNMNSRKRKQYIKELQRELKDDFKDPLKDLSKTQGMILFKMIERELDTPMYDLIRELRSGITATHWNTLASMYGHQLSVGYIPGQDPILDAVLNDLNISYQRPKDRYATQSDSSTQ